MPLNKEQRLALRRRWHPRADEQIFGTVEHALERHIHAGACVLDAGSGTGTWVLEAYAGRIRLLVGADIEPPASTLPRLGAPVVADLARLPFADESFDLILCYNVIEHLAAPMQTFRGFARILRPGGSLVLKTPNLTAPVTLLSSLIPLSLRRRFKGHLGVGSQHVFPTFYRCNTPAKLDSSLRAVGLERELLLVVDQTYDYLYFTRVTYTIGLLYSRLMGAYGPARLRNTIIGVYRKGRTHLSNAFPC